MNNFERQFIETTALAHQHKFGHRVERTLVPDGWICQGNDLQTCYVTYENTYQEIVLSAEGHSFRMGSDGAPVLVEEA